MGVNRFLNEYCPERIAIGRMSTRTLLDYQKQCRATVMPALGGMKVRDVTQAQIERAVAPRGRVQRNRCIALIRRLFNTFEKWGWRDQRTNPCFGIEMGVEEPRDRTLNDAEFGALAEALDDWAERFPMAVGAIRVAAFTGLRIGEVLNIQWDHVDFESGRLKMPKTKSGARVHDLPASALAVLAGMPRRNRYTFAGQGCGTARISGCVPRLRAGRDGCRAVGCSVARPEAQRHDEGGAVGHWRSCLARPLGAQDNGHGR